MNAQDKLSSPEIDSMNYRRIRNFIGILGFFLPVILILFSAIPFFRTGFQGSLSAYYYSNLREFFTGILFAVSFFLICYKGPEKHPSLWLNDTLLTNIAGAMAFLIAILPTNPDDCGQKIYTIIPYCKNWLGDLHYISAGIFFIILAYISVFIFTIGQKTEARSGLINENHIYVFCGILIFVCACLIPFNLFEHATFIFETIALGAFGFTWLVKGRAFGDKGIMGRLLYREEN